MLCFHDDVNGDEGSLHSEISQTPIAHRFPKVYQSLSVMSNFSRSSRHRARLAGQVCCRQMSGEDQVSKCLLL